MTAVYKRELRSYFTSMVGYVFLAVLVFFVGIFFLANNLFAGYPKFSLVLSNVLFILIICISVLTMKSFAEERRSRTDQMLLTYPVSLGSVVLGKYLAMVTVFALPMALFCLCPLIINAAGTAYLAQDYATILAFFLMGCVYIAVGMFISALTESQIIAAVGTFAVLAVLYFWSSLVSFLPSALADVLGTFAFTDAFYNFSDLNVFDVGALVLYLSVAAFFVFLTVQMLRRKRGANTAVATVIALAIVVVVNLIMGQVPSNWKEIDLSDSKIYTISEEGKAYLSELEQPVEIIVFSTEDELDFTVYNTSGAQVNLSLSRFLNSYAAQSDKVSLRYVDTVAHPTAAQEYETTSDTIVVRCEATGKQKVLTYYDLIPYDATYMMYYQQFVATGFDGEGGLTAAIDSVTNESSRKIYQLTGHAETELGETVQAAIEKVNIELDSVSLLKDGIPEDCDLLIAQAPGSDLADSELEMLREYLSSGGQVMVLTSGRYDLPNWRALLEEYGLQLETGIVMDGQRNYAQLGSDGVFAIDPVLSTESSVTSNISDTSQALLLYPGGMTQVDPARDTITVTPFMTTSSQGYLYTGEGQDLLQGTYVLGAVAEEGDGRLIAISVDSLVDESLVTAYSGMSNLTLFMQAATDAFEDVSHITIAAKSLGITYNLVSNVRMWGLLYVIVIPLGVLAGGFVYWFKRRKQ